MNLLHKYAAWNEAQKLNNSTGWQKDKHFRDVVDHPLYTSGWALLGKGLGFFIPGFDMYKSYAMGGYEPAPLDQMRIARNMEINERRPIARFKPQQSRVLEDIHKHSYGSNVGFPAGRWV